MNTEFYRLVGSLKTVDTFISDQYHNVEDGTHGSIDDEKYKESESMKHSWTEVKPQLEILDDVVNQLLKEQAKISHAMFDFRRAMSRNAERFYHAINKLRRKAPEWQIMDEDLLQLIENYQATASSLFFGGDDKKIGVAPGSSSS